MVAFTPELRGNVRPKESKGWRENNLNHKSGIANNFDCQEFKTWGMGCNEKQMENP